MQLLCKSIEDCGHFYLELYKDLVIISKKITPLTAAHLVVFELPINHACIIRLQRLPSRGFCVEMTHSNKLIISSHQADHAQTFTYWNIVLLWITFLVCFLDITDLGGIMCLDKLFFYEFYFRVLGGIIR